MGISDLFNIDIVSRIVGNSGVRGVNNINMRMGNLTACFKFVKF